jgi:glycerol-3-phosphate dehydrogenase
MGDERRTNVEYAEDVDVMILEYLIYRTTKRCIDDFMTRRVNNAAVQPSQGVLTQLHILDGETNL